MTLGTVTIFNMKTIETTANVNSDGTMTLQVPPDIASGKHRIVLVIDEHVTSASINLAEIDAALMEMANDPEYRTEVLQIEAEFAAAQWEALQQTES